MNAIWRRFGERQILMVILLLALLVRLPFFSLQVVRGTDFDIFARWIQQMQTSGLITIYSGVGIDYPPLSLYLFALAGWINSLLPDVLRGDGALNVLIKLPATAADLLTVWLVASALRDKSPSLRIGACALYAFNPAIWYVAAYWTQFDSIYTLLMLVSLLLLARGKVWPAWLVFSLAAGVKLQSVVLAPLLALATLMRFGLRKLLEGLMVGALAGAVVIAPWLLTGQMGNLYRSVTTVVPRITDSGFNLWYWVRFGDVHNVTSALHPPLLPFSYKTAGQIAFAASALFVSYCVWRQKSRALALPAAILNMSLYMFVTEVHERYLFPALVFVLLATALWDAPAPGGRVPRVLWLAYALLTLTFLFNLSAIISFAPALWTNVVAAQPPYSPLMSILKSLAVLDAVANTLILVMLNVALVRAVRE
jgi:dolichyl-phosphate-mannose-protein mannosyltransferase